MFITCFAYLSEQFFKLIELKLFTIYITRLVNKILL